MRVSRKFVGQCINRRCASAGNKVMSVDGARLGLLWIRTKLLL
jgi:hypothetical protein